RSHVPPHRGPRLPVRGVLGAGGRAMTGRVPWRRLVAAMAVAGVWAAVARAQPGSLDSLLPDFRLRPLPGSPPPLTLPGLDPQLPQLEELGGGVGLVDFWASWCPHCSGELPSSIEKLHRELGPQGLTVWAIDIAEPPDHVARWIGQRGISVPVLLDA